MGMPLYGQSFTLTQASNHGLNAPATGPGSAGEFTRAAGFLSYYEVCNLRKLINEKLIFLNPLRFATELKTGDIQLCKIPKAEWALTLIRTENGSATTMLTCF